MLQSKLTKLSKVLALTTSDKDGEALAAIRTANKILANEQTTWSDVIAALTPCASDKAKAKPTNADPFDFEDIRPHYDADDDREPDDWGEVIEGLLNRASLNMRARDFLESVLEQYYRKGRLSEKQEAAVRKFM